MTKDEGKPKKSEMVRRLIDFIFGFENKRGDVLDYQLSHADGFSFSPREFYANVEQQMEDRKIPNMEVSRQEFAEGGALSDQRTYLRLMRARLAIDTCAGPFGKIFFFSCRTVYVKAQVRLWHLLAASVFFYAAVRLLVAPLGIMFAAIAVVTLVFAIAAVMRNASTAAFSDLDALLLRIPVVATIYEDWFRQDTYYREDTRNLYLKILPKIIEDLAKDTCAANGVKLEPHFQRVPPVADFDKPTPPDKS